MFNRAQLNTIQFNESFVIPPVIVYEPVKHTLFKLYNRDNVYVRTISEAEMDYSITKVIDGGSGPLTIILKVKPEDLSDDIILNGKIKIYSQNHWREDPRLVYYGYITSIDPIIRSGEQQTQITLLGAISKLQNDYLQQAGEYLAFEVENKDIDTHIKEIIDNYRDSINETYGDYDPCMLDATANYFADTDFVEDTSSIGKIPYRYFTQTHLDAIKEISKFLPKNLGTAYWYFFLDDGYMDGTGTEYKSRFHLKTVSATADHTLQINKHITSLEIRKNIEGVVNTVYFWNEMGVAGEKVLMTASDSASQTTYDKIADRITDSKITTRTQADLLSQAKLKGSKDEKVEMTCVVSEVAYDILDFEVGQTINIRDFKGSFFSDYDNKLMITKILLTPREATLELAVPRPDLTTQVETDREYIDRQLTWFGNILTRIDASRLEPGGLHWITEDITFSKDDVNLNRKIKWLNGDTSAVGTFKLPNGVQRVIAGGDTGLMDTSLTYYLYVDEKNCWCGKDIGLAAKASGTNGSIKAGENSLVDTSKSWKKDQWKGYVLWVNPDSTPEKHIISQNYEHELLVEGHDPFDTTDSTCEYEIHPFVLRQTTLLSFSGTADSGSSTTLIDDALTQAADFWNGYELKIRSGENIGLTRTVIDFVATADRLVFKALPYAISGGEYYELYLNPETQILIATGVPNTNSEKGAEIIPNITAVESSAIFNAETKIAAGTIPAVAIDVGIKGWTHNLTFSATNYRIVAWTAGILTLSDGTNYTINAGNTGVMSAMTYIYFDTTTSLKYTTTASSSVGTNRILIAVAQNVADIAKKAQFQVFGGRGGVGGTFITADNIAANSITANEIAANTITAGEIAASVISGGKIVAELLTASNIQTGTLNASLVTVTNLNATNITAGTLSVDRISAGSIVAAKIGTDLTDANISSINFNNITASNINATNITVGTLSADRIASTSLGASKLDTTVISGGKIITGLLTASNIQTGTLNASLVTVTNLNASNITTGTLTGRTFKTDFSPNTRVEICNKDEYFSNQIVFYQKLNGTSGEAGWIYSEPAAGVTHGAVTMAGGTDAQIWAVGGSNTPWNVNPANSTYINCHCGPTAADRYIEINKSIIPMYYDNSYDLGNSDYRWRNLYLGNAIFTRDASLRRIFFEEGLTINPGINGEMRYYDKTSAPAKYEMRVNLHDTIYKFDLSWIT